MKKFSQVKTLSKWNHLKSVFIQYMVKLFKQIK